MKFTKDNYHFFLRLFVFILGLITVNMLYGGTTGNLEIRITNSYHKSVWFKINGAHSYQTERAIQPGETCTFKGPTFIYNQIYVMATGGGSHADPNENYICFYWGRYFKEHTLVDKISPSGPNAVKEWKIRSAYAMRSSSGWKLSDWKFRQWPGSNDWILSDDGEIKGILTDSLRKVSLWFEIDEKFIHLEWNGPFQVQDEQLQDDFEMIPICGPEPDPDIEF